MKPRVSYIICTTERSGSQLLRNALQNTNIAGNPRELQFRAIKKLQIKIAGTHPSQYLNSIEQLIELGMTPNRVSGCMLSSGSFECFCAWAKRNTTIRHASAPELVETFFPNPKYIYLSRHDKLGQAVSLVKAGQTGVWGKLKNKPSRYAAEPVFDFNQIDNTLRHIVEDDRRWRDYFKRYDINPFWVTYEDLPNGLESITFELLRYLDVPVSKDLSLEKPRIEKQADALSDMWAEKYKTMLQAYAKPALFLKRLLYNIKNYIPELKRFQNKNRLFLR